MVWSTQRLRYAQRLHGLLCELAEAREEEKRTGEAERARLEDLALLEKHLSERKNEQSLYGPEPMLPDELVVLARDAALVPAATAGKRTADILKRVRFLAAEVERTEGAALAQPEASVPEQGVVSWAWLHGSIVLLMYELEALLGAGNVRVSGYALADFGMHETHIAFANTPAESLAERTELLLKLSGIAEK